MPPEYGETNPPVKRGKITIPAWAWAVGAGLLVQGMVSFATQKFDPFSAMGNQIFGAGLRDWIGRIQQNNKRDDVDG